MKNRFGKIQCSLLLIATCLFFNSCSKDFVSEEQTAILFEKISINYAWGLNYSHWIIDAYGNVRIDSRNDTKIRDTPISVDDMSQFDSIAFTVSKTDLNHYAGMIKKATDGDYTVSEQQRRDFGSVEYYCYYYNKSLGRNIRILLSAQSDAEDKINSSASAANIVEWLSELNRNTYSE